MLETLIKYAPLLLQGVLLTLELVAASAIGGFIVGVLLALAFYSPRWGVRRFVEMYVWFFRGTPLLVQLFLIYYGLAQFDWLKQSFLWRGFLDNPYWCAILALSLNTAAYVAEILRGAIRTVPMGEIDAGKSLGMSRHLRMRRIILPTALRLSVPGLSNEAIILVKASALASTVTLMELTGVIKTLIARTYQPLEYYFFAALIYVLINSLIVRGFKLIERRWPHRYA